MDIKAEVEKIIAQITKDGNLKEKFMKDPAGAVKGIVGEVDKDTLNKIIEAVKAAVAKEGVSGIGDKLKDVVGGLLGGKKDDAKKED
ncbi:MAG: hypothetical protein IK134_04820 [Oscillospiraceae bacterium]|nr:hypothetical protein [Oscillospiraceae bacterium]